MAQLVKNPPAMQETWVRSLGLEDPLEGKGCPLQYSGLENSMDCKVLGSQRVSHNWATFTFTVQMWELDQKEGWALKNWCFWTAVLEKTLGSPLDCKEIKIANSQGDQLVNPKGNKPWIFTGKTYAKAETPILWPPDKRSQFTEKDPDTGKNWGQE